MIEIMLLHYGCFQNLSTWTIQEKKKSQFVSKHYFSISQPAKIPAQLHEQSQNNTANNLLKYPCKELRHPVLLKLCVLFLPNIPHVSKLSHMA